MHWYVALLIEFQHYLKVHSDQVYETLVQEREGREAKGIKDVMICRIEQILPFP